VQPRGQQGELEPGAPGLGRGDLDPELLLGLLLSDGPIPVVRVAGVNKNVGPVLGADIGLRADPELNKLVDVEGQAREWNDAIETAMQVVEGKRTP